ncbi:MAG: hypothetical protein H0W39_07425 [Sphingomonas sp.]|nr:hypothetical protein [Sphingomonas sp.]
MNWPVFIIAFCIAVLTGAAAASLLARIRPQWSDRRRLITSAAALPAVTSAAAVAGIFALLATGPGEGENMQDLALAAIVTIGALFAMIAFVGGLIGAGLRQHRLRR